MYIYVYVDIFSHKIKVMEDLERLRELESHVCEKFRFLMEKINLEGAVPLSPEGFSPAEHVISPKTLIWIRKNFKSKFCATKILILQVLEA